MANDLRNHEKLNVFCSVTHAVLGHVKQAAGNGTNGLCHQELKKPDVLRDCVHTGYIIRRPLLSPLECHLKYSRTVVNSKSWHFAHQALRWVLYLRATLFLTRSY